MEEYIGIRYNITGVYGEIEYIKTILKGQLDITFKKYIEAFKRYETYKDISPDVSFSVNIRNQNGEDLFCQYDIEGLPIFIGLDMGTYFKMAQLREMSQHKYSITINSLNNYDRLLRDAIEKMPEILANETKKNITI